MPQSMLEQKLQTIVEPVLADHGARLVQIAFKANVLQILVEGADGSRMGVDDFADISRELSPALEVEDPIPGAYRLEISSPGIDRPLITPEDFSRFAGFEARIEIDPPQEDGQKRFRGKVLGIDNAVITVNTDNQGEVQIPYAAVSKAKLILTDDLIDATKDKH